MRWHVKRCAWGWTVLNPWHGVELARGHTRRDWEYCLAWALEQPLDLTFWEPTG